MREIDPEATFAVIENGRRQGEQQVHRQVEPHELGQERDRQLILEVEMPQTRSL